MWVKNSANHWVFAWECGAVHCFLYIICLRLLLDIFCFKSVQQKYQVISKTVGEVRRIAFRALPILSCPLRCANTNGAAILTLLTQGAQRIKKNCGISLLGL